MTDTSQHRPRSRCRLIPGIRRPALLALLLPVLAAAPALSAERRCGWLENPTPNNLWLRDADGEWTLNEQGGHEAEGLDSLPARRDREWVVTNGSSYGYGCVCLRVETEAGARTRLVRRVLSGATEPLSRCRRDPRLPPRPKGDGPGSSRPVR